MNTELHNHSTTTELIPDLYALIAAQNFSPRRRVSQSRHVLVFVARAGNRNATEIQEYWIASENADFRGPTRSTFE